LLQSDGSFKDAIAATDLDHLSVSFFSPHFARHHGGTGANIAWSVRLLGGDPLLVGTVGNDGGAYAALLNERGISIDHIEAKKEHVTATAIIGTDNAERQIAFFHPGADAHGSWPDLSDDRDDIAFAIVSPRAANLMVEAALWCASQKLQWIFDPGQQVHTISTDDLRRAALSATGIVVNSYEWLLLAERLRMTPSDLLSHTEFLIVTNGEKGLTIYERGDRGIKTKNLPACTPEKIINPTGAGDALRAGVLVGLANGKNIIESAKLGAALASFVVEQEGTLLDSVDMDEVEERMKRTYRVE